MNLRIDPGAETPASEQVRRQVASAIVRGRLRPGERLPTIRDLAAKLGIAANTVAKAYRALGASHLVVGRGRRGTFVADFLPEPPDDARARLDQAASAYARRARQLGFGMGEAVRAVRRVRA